MISRIIKVEVGALSRSRRLRLITLTETLIILDITKTELDMITLRNHVPRSYMTRSPVTLSVLDMVI